MKICVLVKSVIDKDSRFEIKEGLVHFDSYSDRRTNESDNYALEEALLIKESSDQDVEVVVVCLGSEDSSQSIKDCLSKGADRAIHILDEKFNNLDALSISKVLKNALEEEKFDIILSGLQSDDIGNGQIGILLSEHLNMSHASLAMETELNGTERIRVKRELEAGWFQWTTLSLPASITIQSGINKPRYASLRGIMMMKKKPIKVLSYSDIGIELNQATSLLEQSIPKKEKETKFFDGETDSFMDDLINLMTNDLKVI